MIVELIGLPGAGKTTLMTEIYKRADLGPGRQMVYPLSGLENELRHKVPAYIKGQPGRAALYNSLHFAHDYAECLRLFRKHIRPGDVNTELLFLLTGVEFQNLAHRRGRCCVFDEGLLHRGSAHIGASEDLEPFVAAAPPSDLLIHLKINSVTAFRRCVARNGDEYGRRRRVMNKHGNIDDFAAKGVVQDRVVAAAQGRIPKVIELDALEPPETLAQKVLEHVG